MARLIDSIAALVILAIGVASFNPWENILNMPVDDLEEILETDLFQPRQIRTHPCNCTSRTKSLDLGQHHHPRYLVTHECEDQTCTQNLIKCQSIKYTVNVSVFTDTDSCTEENLFNTREACYCLQRTIPKTITVACIPVPSDRFTRSNRIRP